MSGQESVVRIRIEKHVDHSGSVTSLLGNSSNDHTIDDTAKCGFRVARARAYDHRHGLFGIFAFGCHVCLFNTLLLVLGKKNFGIRIYQPPDAPPLPPPPPPPPLKPPLEPPPDPPDDPLPP